VPSPRILIVDDESSIRLTLGANFELADFEVIEADGPRQAMELLAAQRFDLVLSDVLMPGMTGVSLFRHVKQHYPETPVILMTAYALDELIKGAISEGVYTVLPKPFDVERAVDLLARAIRRPMILVLDQAPQAGAPAVEALQAAGLRVQVATDRESACRSARSGGIDVCLVDMTDDPGQAHAIAQELLGAAPAVELAIISGPIPADVMARLAQLGVRHFVGRPFTGAQLVETVAKLRGRAVAE
jgi:DNA-binding NtrC family response regulator